VPARKARVSLPRLENRERRMWDRIDGEICEAFITVYTSRMSSMY